MATHSSILAWRIPMDRGAWWATLYRVAKSQTHLKQLTVHAPTSNKSVIQFLTGTPPTGNNDQFLGGRPPARDSGDTWGQIWLWDGRLAGTKHVPQRHLTGSPSGTDWV